jgi:hypothetical protein
VRITIMTIVIQDIAKDQMVADYDFRSQDIRIERQDQGWWKLVSRN